jgi:hypothetical protein
VVQILSTLLPSLEDDAFEFDSLLVYTRSARHNSQGGTSSGPILRLLAHRGCGSSTPGIRKTNSLLSHTVVQILSTLLPSLEDDAFEFDSLLV